MVNSRQKGARGELEVAAAFRRAFPDMPDVRRTGFHQAQQDSVSPDVDVPGLWLEVKRGKQPNIRKALEQAQGDTDGRTPVAVTRADRGEWLVTLTLEDFLGMWEP